MWKNLRELDEAEEEAWDSYPLGLILDAWCILRINVFLASAL